MNKYKIVQDLDALREKSEPVASVEEATGILSKLGSALASHDNGLGLAAVQIGIPKRVGIMTKTDGSKMTLINPEFVEADEEFIFMNEGCLSFPDHFINTKRYRQFVIKNQVIDGDEFREEIQYFYYDTSSGNSDGLLAIQVQHELDHFDGILFQEHEDDTKIVPIKTDKKIGRNEKCPCGSGKKYKKCCMA